MIDTTPGRTSFVFFLALALRLAHLLAVSHSPFATILLGDASAYDAWAQRIAAGDVWGDTVFYQAPLYPYFLGLIYAIAGPDLFVVRLIQAIFGALSCALLTLAGTRFFNARAGLVAGLLLAVYPPAIFFDLTFQKTVLDTLLLTALLAVLPTTAIAPVARLRRWLAAGVLLGALCLTRENALALVPVILVYSVWRVSRTSDTDMGRRRIAAAGAFLVGVVAVLGPVAMRNRLVGGEFALTTAQFGPNFYMGNHAGATGLYSPLRPGREHPDFERADATEIAEQSAGRRLSPGEVSEWWRNRAIDDIRRDPAGWLRLLARKWMLVWNGVEISDAEDIGSYAEFSPVLRLPMRILHFGVLVPAAAAGVVLTWSRRRELWMLYAITLVFAASVALVYVFARYRFPLVPMLALFCGAALDAMFGVLRPLPDPRAAGVLRSSRLRIACALAGGFAAAFAANWNMLPGFDPRLATWNNLGLALLYRGDTDAAVRCFDRILAQRDDLPEARNNLATALLVRGDVPGAGPACPLWAIEIVRRLDRSQVARVLAVWRALVTLAGPRKASSGCVGRPAMPAAARVSRCFRRLLAKPGRGLF